MAARGVWSARRACRKFPYMPVRPAGPVPSLRWAFPWSGGVGALNPPCCGACTSFPQAVKTPSDCYISARRRSAGKPGGMPSYRGMPGALKMLARCACPARFPDRAVRKRKNGPKPVFCWCACPRPPRGSRTGRRFSRLRPSAIAGSSAGRPWRPGRSGFPGSRCALPCRPGSPAAGRARRSRARFRSGRCRP